MRMASSDWPQIALGEILTERTEVPEPSLLESGAIPIVSKIRFSDGKIELRSETATKTKMILIRPGDLVLSGINAMKGAIAIYAPEMPTPAAATIHYAAYQMHKSGSTSATSGGCSEAHSSETFCSSRFPRASKQN